jgi:lipoyl(octanoyl) transferase
MNRGLEIRRLGLVDYGEALELQRQLVEERRADRIPDTLLLLQHPPVITLGVKARGGRRHVLASPESLRASGVAMYDTGRGGDVTYHGPGQLVGYPILDLRPDRCDVHRYVRDIEEALIQTTSTFGIEASRLPGLTGVWAGGSKLAAIGVRISRWITSHGFAYNVAPNLEHFAWIVPCGISDRGVTSLAVLTGSDIRMSQVEDQVSAAFAAIFDRRLLVTT